MGDTSRKGRAAAGGVGWESAACEWVCSVPVDSRRGGRLGRSCSLKIAGQHVARLRNKGPDPLAELLVQCDRGGPGKLPTCDPASLPGAGAPGCTCTPSEAFTRPAGFRRSGLTLCCKGKLTCSHCICHVGPQDLPQRCSFARQTYRTQDPVLTAVTHDSERIQSKISKGKRHLG